MLIVKTLYRWQRNRNQTNLILFLMNNSKLKVFSLRFPVHMCPIKYDELLLKLNCFESFNDKLSSV